MYSVQGSHGIFVSCAACVLYLTSVSTCMTVVVFCLFIISDTTSEFVPGDNKKLLNRTELNGIFMYGKLLGTTTEL